MKSKVKGFCVGWTIGSVVAVPVALVVGTTVAKTAVLTGGIALLGAISGAFVQSYRDGRHRANKSK